MQSIWRAWEALKSWLCWTDDGCKKGVSIVSLNVWWSSVITHQGSSLASLQWIHAHCFYKKGIVVIANFFSSQTKDWIPYEVFKQMYNLKPEDKTTYDIV